MKAFILFVTLCFCLHGNASDATFSLSNIDSTTLQNEFPYEAYLSSGILQRPADLHRDKLYLTEKGADGERIVYQLCKLYLEQQPPALTDFDDLRKKLRMAEAFALKHELFPDSKAYYASKDLLFDAVAKTIEEAIKNGEANPNDPNVLYLVMRLEENKYHLNIRKSVWSKLLFHIGKGNWSYIFDRFTKRYQDYWLEITLAVLVFALPFVLFWFRRRFRR
ncbi:MAG: hypothetical protein F6K17_28065 [Okeania sp. SIO3C4]|nr:hypothetical protein [Okeania sp. SIO3C4]